MTDPTSAQQAPPHSQPTFQELLQGGITTATHVIKKQTRDCYASYFKKFCEFCVANEYPDPAKFRHHELPSLLVAFMESVSSSSDVSHQTAEKIRAAVANYYGSYERRDAAGPDKWMVETDEIGNKTGLGNPARDAFVRQFMRGLKKRKTSEFTQRQATPISLAMLQVLHCHLDIASGFPAGIRLWFCAVSAFAFYGMCRINEVLSLQWKNLSLEMTRPSKDDRSMTVQFGSYKLEGRKTEVAEGRRYNLHHLDEAEKPIDAILHLTAWIKYVKERTDHTWSDSDFVFPSLAKISKAVLKTDSPLTGCENAHVQWGKKMTEQAFITLLNCAVRDLNKHGNRLRGYVRQEWRNIWFTSHTFRRAGAQYCFMFAAPERRWSLRMVKWWAGWTQNESAETLLRYLLDQTSSDEDRQLADCLAPDREAHIGCPTTYTGKKRRAALPLQDVKATSAFENRLKKVEESVAAVEDKLGILISLLQPSDQTNPMPVRAQPTDEEQTSTLPPAKDWKDLFHMYWKEDPSRHLFKPVCKWTSHDKKTSGVLPSCLSVAKLIAEDVAAFAAQKAVPDPAEISPSLLSDYAEYYTKYAQPAGSRTDMDVLTIDTLARYIRLDRKRRAVRSRHAYLNV